MMLLGFLGLVLLGGVLVALLVGAGVFFQRQAGSGGASGESERATAREVLDRRLALGEISREEYETIRDQIRS
jgi:uncharacterized membrane protein